MEDKHFKMITFSEDGMSLDVRFDAEKETVWLTQAEMAELFGVDVDTVGLHLRNIYREKELEDSTYEESSVVRMEGNRRVRRRIRIYDLDAVIAVGYRVKSRRGLVFRRWANSVLKQYLMEGYALNEKRLAALHRTVEVQRALLAHFAEGAGADTDEVIRVIDRFTAALNILDDYDHQCLIKPKKSDREVAYLSRVL